MSADQYNVFEYDKLQKQKNSIVPGRHLNRQVMCGACNFICCKSKIFIVETTVAESKKLNLPLAFPQNGGCSECLPDGCRHGDDKPVFCRLYPFVVNHNGTSTTSQWVLMNCPTPKNFEFVGVTEDGKYHYKKKENLKGHVRNNIQAEIFLDKPIELFPNILENNVGALLELFGEGWVRKLREGLEKMNEEDRVLRAKEEAKKEEKGFGLVDKNQASE